MSDTDSPSFPHVEQLSEDAKQLVIQTLERMRAGDVSIEVMKYGHPIGDEGCIIIAKELGVNKTVRFLDLSCNKISSKGALALANVLGGGITTPKPGDGSFYNSTLQSLNLTMNDVGNEGARALMLASGRNFALEHLEIHGGQARVRFQIQAQNLLS